MKDLRGRFILSLNDLPEVRQLFAGFRIEALETTYTIAGGTGSRRAVELIITGPGDQGHSQPLPNCCTT